MKRISMFVELVSLVTAVSLAQAAVIQVGPTRIYTTVQAGVNAAAAGDTIEIDPGTYTQSAGWASIGKANLIIRGVGASRPILDAAGSSLSGKAIFIITGSGTGVTVENLEFENCACTSWNGAGIRQECANLTVRNCYFHDNEDGILANAVAGSSILVENTEFNHNGHGDGQSHNMYIGAVDSFTLRYSWTHNANVGHEIKTRALKNYILYNRIGNEGGTGSYECSACQGGTTYVIGNQIEQSSTTGNSTIVDYASEGELNPDSHLYLVNNTIVNNRSTCIFVNNHATTAALLQNNIFQGSGTVLSGPGTQTTNWPTSNAYLANPSIYDYHLTAGSTGAINMGTAPGTGIDGFSLTPANQYVHPCSTQARPTVGTIDIGAYEYGSATNQAPVVDAGQNQTITWPTNMANLDGTVTDDGLPNPPGAVMTTWSKVSGPGTVTFGNASTVDTTATFSTTGTYVLQLLANDSALQSTDTVTITVNAAATDNVATGETPVYGTVTGSYIDTQTSNNVYESIREVVRSGQNYSSLEHHWTFNVTGGSSVTFYLEAYRPTNSDGDNFTFAYSTNGTTWTNMVTVSKSADDNNYQTFTMPGGTVGTVYVHVVDTNHSKNKKSLDTIYVDHMFFRSVP